MRIVLIGQVVSVYKFGLGRMQNRLDSFHGILLRGILDLPARIIEHDLRCILTDN